MAKHGLSAGLLGQHLIHAVSLLRSKEVPIDWPQLLHDIKGWNHERRDVQRAWARAFWRTLGLDSADTKNKANKGD